jgi:hypothetical protein
MSEDPEQRPPPYPVHYARPQPSRGWSAGWVVLIVLLSLLGGAALLFGACVLSMR